MSEIKEQFKKDINKEIQFDNGLEKVGIPMALWGARWAIEQVIKIQETSPKPFTEIYKMFKELK